MAEIAEDICCYWSIHVIYLYIEHYTCHTLSYRLVGQVAVNSIWLVINTSLRWRKV